MESTICMYVLLTVDGWDSRFYTRIYVNTSICPLNAVFLYPRSSSIGEWISSVTLLNTSCIFLVTVPVGNITTSVIPSLLVPAQWTTRYSTDWAHYTRWCHDAPKLSKIKSRGLRFIFLCGESHQRLVEPLSWLVYACFRRPLEERVSMWKVNYWLLMGDNGHRIGGE